MSVFSSSVDASVFIVVPSTRCLHTGAAFSLSALYPIEGNPGFEAASILAQV